jgi:DNA-binding MarR family transcriptional regulator
MAKKITAPIGGLVSLWSRPGFLVRRLHQIGVSIFTEEMADLELTPVQFGAMSIIGVNPGIEQSALGVQLGIDRANVADVVARLAKSGLLLRELSPVDRRAKNMYLTERGSEVVLEANRRFKRVQDRLLSPLKARDRAVFVDLLLALIKANNSLGRAELRLTDP